MPVNARSSMCALVTLNICAFCIPNGFDHIVVRAFAHGAMGRRIDPSWWNHLAISCSSQCFTTGVTKAVACVIMSLG